MELFSVSNEWKSAYPGAHAGVLVMRNVSNPAHHAELEKRKMDLESTLRARFGQQDRATLANLDVIKAYENYYKKFKKTYHVQAQLESVVFKNKSIPSAAALVEAMFMAELADMLLTAGHDLDALDLPLRLEISKGDEPYTLMRGQDQVVKAGDMMIVDRQGIISDVIYGPDQRTQIKPTTRNVAFTAYAPPGINADVVQHHLENIQSNVSIITPDATTELLRVFGTD